MIEKLFRTEKEWKRILTPDQYRVMREGETEPAFSCAWPGQSDGIYACAACGLPLFHSEAKFESGTGWPSYFAPVDDENLEKRVDRSLSMERMEILCARCDSHLGHVFDDGPPPSGKRYCINSVALKFIYHAKPQ